MDEAVSTFDERFTYRWQEVDKQSMKAFGGPDHIQCKMIQYQVQRYTGDKLA
jgi:hypothetical protein